MRLYCKHFAILKEDFELLRTHKGELEKLDLNVGQEDYLMDWVEREKLVDYKFWESYGDPRGSESHVVALFSLWLNQR